MHRKPLPPDAVLGAGLQEHVGAINNKLSLSPSKFQSPPPYCLHNKCEVEVKQANRSEQNGSTVPALSGVDGLLSVNRSGNPPTTEEQRDSIIGTQKLQSEHDVNSPPVKTPHVQQSLLSNYSEARNSLIREVVFEDQLPVAQTKVSSKKAALDQDSKSSKLAKSLEEASLFLGGLLKRPTESTKHFTILRHGHGLVYYKGPATSIAITVFSDRPLPPERRYWLQLKGWSGNTGMALKAAMRANNSWINVTPTRRVQSTAVSALDERAWQRDINKFLAKSSKTTTDHISRETVILRIPGEATDGYFRAVLTNGDSKYMLCPSPVFRIASTSTSASSIKGSSLVTFPIELGINIIQSVASQATSTFVSPYTAAVQQGVSQIIPQTLQTYGPTAYSLSGAERFVGSINENYESRISDLARDPSSEMADYTASDRPDVIGSEDGPEAPYPITVTGVVVRGTDRGTKERGVPIANLDVEALNQVAIVTGVYFGWAFVRLKDSFNEELHSAWRQAVVTVDYDTSKIAQVAAQKLAKVHLLHNFEGQNFLGAKMDLYIMGYLRPISNYNQGAFTEAEMLKDIHITKRSLDRDCWKPEDIMLQLKKVKSDRSFLEHLTEARILTQQQIDKVPFHRLGVRTDSAGLTDRNIFGNGGLYIVRDEEQARNT